MAETTYKLTSPQGVKVTVTGAARRDILIKRGYTEGHSAKAAEKAETKGKG